jgi:hypothetical protein
VALLGGKHPAPYFQLEECVSFVLIRSMSWGCYCFDQDYWTSHCYKGSKIPGRLKQSEFTPNTGGRSEHTKQTTRQPLLCGKNTEETATHSHPMVFGFCWCFSIRRFLLSKYQLSRSNFFFMMVRHSSMLRNYKNRKYIEDVKNYKNIGLNFCLVLHFLIYQLFINLNITLRWRSWQGPDLFLPHG